MLIHAKTFGTPPIEGSYWLFKLPTPSSLAMLKRAASDRTGYEVEDVGWSAKRVWCHGASKSMPGHVVLDDEVGPSETGWQPTAGVKGRLERFFNKFNTTEGETRIMANLYDGVVIKTTMEEKGKHTDIAKPEVVFATDKPVFAKDEKIASGKVLAAASKAGVDISDDCIEVRLRPWA